MASYSDVEGVSFQITTSWTLKTEGKHRNSVSYTYNLDTYLGYGKLGGDDPLVEVSKQLKNLRDDWMQVANGGRRTSVEVFDGHDRERAASEAREAFRAFSKNDSETD